MSATGQTQIVLNDSIVYDPQNGASVKKRSKHKTYALALAYVQSVPGFNAYKWSITPLDVDEWHEVTMESQNGSYTGSGSTTVNDDPSAPLVDAWELVPNVVEKDVLESDATNVLALTDNDVTEIRKCLDSGDAPDLSSSAADDLFLVMKSGFKNIRVIAPTIRHTRLMRRDFTVQQAYDRVGKIFTTSSLKTYENVPAQVLFDLPHTSDPTRTDGVVVHYGWYKKPASIQQVSGGQWQIVQEYDWGLWAEVIYGTTV